MNRERQKKRILKDLERKIVFLVGPRQVGKTWLAREVEKDFPGSVYLNYDNTEHRDIIKNQAWLPRTPLVIFDEIHKMRGWKNYLKGVFDTRPAHLRMLVTGSARLDAHRSEGDSLAGRYFVHHLMPITLAELKNSSWQSNIDRLFERGGFPEPFLVEDATDALRWRTLYVDALLRGDVLDFAEVENTRAMRQIFDLLRYKVGSPISASALARDVGVSPIMVKRYLSIFEALYLIFHVRPYTYKIARAILKEPKVYFYDHALVEGGDGPRFENMVAVALQASVTTENDCEGTQKRVGFVKTKEGKETDFVIVSNERKPELLVEAKVSNNTASAPLLYFSSKYNIKGVQVVRNIGTERVIGEHIELRGAVKFLEELVS